MKNPLHFPCNQRLKSLQKNEPIWNKIGNIIGKKLMKNQVMIDNILQINLYNCRDGKIKTYFQGKKNVQRKISFVLIARNST